MAERKEGKKNEFADDEEQPEDFQRRHGEENVVENDFRSTRDRFLRVFDVERRFVQLNDQTRLQGQITKRIALFAVE